MGSKLSMLDGSPGKKNNQKDRITGHLPPARFQSEQMTC